MGFDRERDTPPFHGRVGTDAGGCRERLLHVHARCVAGEGAGATGRRAVGASDASYDDACDAAMRSLGVDWAHAAQHQRLQTCQRLDATSSMRTPATPTGSGEGSLGLTGRVAGRRGAAVERVQIRRARRMRAVAALTAICIRDARRIAAHERAARRVRVARELRVTGQQFALMQTSHADVPVRLPHCAVGDGAMTTPPPPQYRLRVRSHDVRLSTHVPDTHDAASQLAVPVPQSQHVGAHSAGRVHASPALLVPARTVDDIGQRPCC